MPLFDSWLLNKIMELRKQGLDPARNPDSARSGLSVSALASVGRAQKLINIYLKYEFCWQIAGQFINHNFVVPYRAQIPALKDLICALHAPIDRILINEFLNLPVGNYLKSKGLLRSGEIRQSMDGAFRPWSKLECLRTYYGFQLLFRRIAMATWPQGFDCSNSLSVCAQMFDAEFADREGITPGFDWIRESLEIPMEVISKTIACLSKINMNEINDQISTQENESMLMVQTDTPTARALVVVPASEPVILNRLSNSIRISVRNAGNSFYAIHEGSVGTGPNIGYVCKGMASPLSRAGDIVAYTRLQELLNAAGCSHTPLKPRPANSPHGNPPSQNGSWQLFTTDHYRHLPLSSGSHPETSRHQTKRVDDGFRFLEQYFEVGYV